MFQVSSSNNGGSAAAMACIATGPLSKFICTDRKPLREVENLPSTSKGPLSLQDSQKPLKENEAPAPATVEPDTVVENLEIQEYKLEDKYGPNTAKKVVTHKKMTKNERSLYQKLDTVDPDVELNEEEEVIREGNEENVVDRENESSTNRDTVNPVIFKKATNASNKKEVNRKRKIEHQMKQAYDVLKKNKYGARTG
ncbi:unnamed protein product [Colias eurytheme]|nr:unnamed protein product [Colias eurytheme]